MAKASAVKRETCTCAKCGFRPPWKDTMYIEEHEVTHVICYNCGNEWVE